MPAGDTLFAAYKKYFGEQRKPLPASWDGVGYRPHAYQLATYAAMVFKLDAYVGLVLAKPKTLGIAKNPQMIVTSDKRPHSEGGNRPAYFNSNGGLGGIKRDLYEGDICVPMQGGWLQQIKKNRRKIFF